MSYDTIAAIATAAGNSGIGIIRLSGSEAIQIANKIYVTIDGGHKLDTYGSHTIHYGFIYDEDELKDEVMVAVMKAPKTYTTEDIVEIQCHGNMLMLTDILELVIKNGARLAQPGEFTKRAFLNGRIDLSKAEAVMDMIHSQNEIALKNSMNQLRGGVESIIKKIREEILYEIAYIESALDDPEHISLDGYQEKIQVKIDSLQLSIDKLIKSFNSGKLIREGIKTVIVGKPNAGKSSLLNLLLGEEKAIVTEVAGTTRDILEEYIRLDEIMLHMIDTAGIHDTNDIVEKIGVEKAKKCISEADLILYVIDSSTDLDENDSEIIEMLKDKKVILLLNKSDLYDVNEKNKIDSVIERTTYHDIIKTSMKEGTGIEELKSAISAMFFAGEIDIEQDIMITNLRHKELLIDAEESLKLTKESVEQGMPEDFISIDLMNAYTSLGYIIGEEVTDDLVQEIFSKFCMGK